MSELGDTWSAHTWIQWRLGLGCPQDRRQVLLRPLLKSKDSLVRSARSHTHASAPSEIESTSLSSKQASPSSLLTRPSITSH